MRAFRLLAFTAIISFVVLGTVVVSAQSNSASTLSDVKSFATTVPLKFSTEKFYESGGFEAIFIAVADVNLDGIPDLVLTNCGNLTTEVCPGEGSVGVLLGNGDGTFQPAVSYDSGADYPRSVAIADVNGDGIPDLIVANSESANGSPEGMIAVLLGNGNGTFQTAVTYDAGGVYSYSVAVADLNGDGVPDIVVSENQSEVNCGICFPSYIGVLLGKGNGTFRRAVTYSAGGYFGTSIALADVNGDGRLDVLVASECDQLNPDCADIAGSEGTVGVLLGNGNGTFQTSVNYDSGAPYALGLTVADMNGDGIADLIVGNAYSQTSNSTGTVALLLGNGDGTFQSAVGTDTPEVSPYSVTTADFNGDGYLDVLLATDNSYTRSVAILLGNGDGTFQPMLHYGSGVYGEVLSAATADLNRDGRPDIVVSNQCFTRAACTKTFPESSAGVFLNEYKAETTMTITGSPNPSQVGQSVTFTATVTSATMVPNGSTVTFSHGTITLGTGTTKNGIATFTTSFSKAGSDVIKASYAGDAFHLKSSHTVTQTVQAAP
jgi:hypothetical protein